MSTTAKTVKWTKRGRKRFHEQLIYISNNNCRDEAARWALRVIRVTRTLNDFPLSGRIVPEISRAEIREHIVDGHFRVIYKVRPHFCDILSIRHTAFLIKSMRSL